MRAIVIGAVVLSQEDITQNSLVPSGLSLLVRDERDLLEDTNACHAIVGPDKGLLWGEPVVGSVDRDGDGPEFVDTLAKAMVVVIPVLSIRTQSLVDVVGRLVGEMDEGIPWVHLGRGFIPVKINPAHSVTMLERGAPDGDDPLTALGHIVPRQLATEPSVLQPADGELS